MSSVLNSLHSETADTGPPGDLPNASGSSHTHLWSCSATSAQRPILNPKEEERGNEERRVPIYRSTAQSSCFVSAQLPWACPFLLCRRGVCHSFIHSQHKCERPLCKAESTEGQNMALIKECSQGGMETGQGSWRCMHVTGMSSGDAQGGELMKLGGMDSSSATW